MHDSEAKCTWIGSDDQANNNGTVQTGICKWTVGEDWAVGTAGHLRTVKLFAEHADSPFKNLA